MRDGTLKVRREKKREMRWGGENTREELEG